MGKFQSAFLIILIIILSAVAFQQHQIVENQKTQMKQQFHSDLIALSSLFGKDGLKFLFLETNPKDLSARKRLATSLLLQRIVTAYWIRDAFTDDEWRMIVKEVHYYMSKSPLLRARWEEVKSWYPKKTQNFVDKMAIESRGR